MTAWTDDRVEHATTLWLKGYSAAMIAKEMCCGFSRNAVIGKLTRIGVVRPRLPSANLRIPPAPAPKPKYAAKLSAIRPQPGGKGERVSRAEREARARTAKPEPVAKPVLLSGLERPWTERAFGQCNWIVAGAGADSLACCAKVYRRGWCKGHFDLGTIPQKDPPANRARPPREAVRAA